MFLYLCRAFEGSGSYQGRFRFISAAFQGAFQVHSGSFQVHSGSFRVHVRSISGSFRFMSGAFQEYSFQVNFRVVLNSYQGQQSGSLSSGREPQASVRS